MSCKSEPPFCSIQPFFPGCKGRLSLSRSLEKTPKFAHLRQTNKILTATLNKTRVENAALCGKINQLSGEILDLRGEVAGLEREKQIITSTARATESDIQRKLAVSLCFFGFLMSYLS